jgi:predicted NAD/FAD-binding protein
MSTYQTDAEIENVVRSFEACEIDKEAFKHRDHLIVAIWYVETLGREAALARMRSSLMRFLDHHGVDKKKYSEPVTVFWIDKVAEKLKELGSEVSLVRKCNTIVQSLEFQKDAVNLPARTPAARVEAEASPVRS